MSIAITELHTRLALQPENQNYEKMLELFQQCYKAGVRDGKFELLQIASATDKRVAHMIAIRARGAVNERQ